MSACDFLKDRFPDLGNCLPRLNLASLPTPVKSQEINVGNATHSLSIKYDNLTGTLYGGNKVRKLEYIFPRAIERHRLRIATFGAVGSNHALATALYARKAGFDCTCLLSHQAKTPLIGRTLNAHVKNNTELICYGGSYHERIGILRKSLWGRHTWVIPIGGSSWLGTMGFVAAGLELTEQIKRGEIPKPDRLYVGTGTMGTAVGLALGLASGGLDTEINAVRITPGSLTNLGAIRALTCKTAAMMHALDETVPPDLAGKTNIRLRDEFFGPGYAESTIASEAAVRFGLDQLDLALETTYTGKTLAAVLSDLQSPTACKLNPLYWHTYNSAPLDVPADRPLDTNALPENFLQYFSN
ncbi:MAG: 1-aminocyclopropane-1-carboxylate deaminase/D-cysteine desulfhydrase [Woeseiaceae bacterium]